VWYCSLHVCWSSYCLRKCGKNGARFCSSPSRHHVEVCRKCTTKEKKSNWIGVAKNGGPVYKISRMLHALRAKSESIHLLVRPPCTKPTWKICGKIRTVLWPSVRQKWLLHKIWTRAFHATKHESSYQREILLELPCRTNTGRWAVRRTDTNESSMIQRVLQDSRVFLGSP
jgi:hypothetical protein